jgi:type I restriction enzyme M protein
MALKKSEMYSSLWQSCDELRGGMDASQYKDYVLSLLFIKYISDKYAGQPFAAIKTPTGAGFADMVALKGKPDIGDQINKKIVAPLVAANRQLSLSDFPDFNDPVKLGDGKEKVDRLTNLIAIFEGPALDFSKNRAEGDDILGDAYEYLMRHFATESGKSKGQFYTPAEVSRVIAQVLGIRQAATTNATTVYDPTCGSGSLLLKVADAARTPVTLYGQEKDATTAGLARMNMILHNYPTASIMQGNTLTDPKFKEGDALKRFDYVVANPPFSDKRWSTGLDPEHDEYERFKTFGAPPAKQGDYAYLLHIVHSLKSTGIGACILPHGVLFRGNAEAAIRRNLVRRGYIQAIIGLPPNLFYGTGIPACIVVVDKAAAHRRDGIFMIDASAGFMKDGPKNRLRAQDIHRIVDVFTRQADVPKYARMVPYAEIEQNDYNLNLPRYIDSQAAEDLQDIAGHLQGGIPAADVNALAGYWRVLPQVKQTIFAALRPGYFDLAVEKTAIKQAIYAHPEFVAFTGQMNELFAAWRARWADSGIAEPQLGSIADPQLGSAARLWDRRAPARLFARSSRAGARRSEDGRPEVPATRLPPQGTGHRAGGGSAGALHRPPAGGQVRHLSALHGLLGGNDAGRLLSDRRRRLAGADDAPRRGRQEGARARQGLDVRPGAQGADCGALLCRRAGRHRPTGGGIGEHRRATGRTGRRTGRRRGRLCRTGQGEQGGCHGAAQGDRRV